MSHLAPPVFVGGCQFCSPLVSVRIIPFFGSGSLNKEAWFCSDVSWHFIATNNQQNLDDEINCTSLSYILQKITVEHVKTCQDRGLS